MKKLFLINLVVSIISLESQAEDYGEAGDSVCHLFDEDIYEFRKELREKDRPFDCGAGDTINLVHDDEPILAMSYMIEICKDDSIKVYRYDDKYLHASCVMNNKNKMKLRRLTGNIFPHP